MSAIYGSIAYNLAEIFNKTDIIKKYDEYKFDRIDSLKHETVDFYCFHQYITEESKTEVLPYFDSTSNLLMTADAIIDNRVELFSKLNITDKTVSDSYIILQAYKKWGKLCGSHLLGAFVIVIFDFKKNELIIIRDQLGSKILYYKNTNDVIKFSTLVEPLVEAENINSSFIRKMMASQVVLDNYSDEESIYENIKIVPPATVLTFSNNVISKKKYWSLPVKIKQEKEHSITVIREFKEIMDEAISCRMRTFGEVGILLSGGYDSSAIACKAAEILLTKSKNLITFTSIPSSEFDVKSPKGYTYDESRSVVIMKNKYSNMINNFVDSKDDSPIKSMDEILSILERPYGFQNNGYWIKNCLNKANQENCKVVLNGTLGNINFSFANMDRYYIYLIKTLKLRKFYSIFTRNCRLLAISRKKTFINLIKKYFLKMGTMSVSLNSFSSVDKKEKKEMETVYNSLNQTFEVNVEFSKSFRNVTQPARLNHISESETKFNLTNRIIQRDPTKDVRVIEYCHRLGIDSFNNNGYSRTLAVGYMNGLVPDEIIEDPNYGLQSSDLIDRIKNDWNYVVMTLIEDIELLDGYVDIEILKMFLEKNKCIDSESSSTLRCEIRQILKLLSLLKFIKKSYN